MPSLRDFESLHAVKVRLNGKTFDARPLSVAETDALVGAFPLPEPPRKRPPGTGSKADKVADRDDPGYRAALATINRKLDLVELAWAIGYECEGGRTRPSAERCALGGVDIGGQAKQYADLAYAELSAKLTGDDVAAALVALRRAGDLGQLDEAARGN